MDDGPSTRRPDGTDGTGDERGRAAGASQSDGAGTEAMPGDGTEPMPGAGIDPVLLQRARGLTDAPLDARAEAFDELNRDVVTALRAIEEL